MLIGNSKSDTLETVNPVTTDVLLVGTVYTVVGDGAEDGLPTVA